MIYVGENKATLYYGDYHPAALYRGENQIAGWINSEKSIPASWENTYNDYVDVQALGKGKQQTYSGKNLLLPEKNVVAYNGVTAERLADGRYHISGTPTAATTLALGIHGGSLSLAAGTYTLAAPATADVGVALGPGYMCGTFSLAEEAIFTLFSIDVYAAVVGQELDFVYAPQLEVGSVATAYEPYVGGQPSPSPDYPQPLVAAESSLMSSGRTGTTPTTVTLPVLRAIPGTDIRDTLAYIGGGQWRVTRRVGEIVVDGETAKWELSLDKAFWNLTQKAPGVGQDMSGKNSIGLQISSNQRYELLFSTPKWGAAIGIDSVDALNALCQTTPMTIWYALVTPTTETVTLGELPSYPVQTTLTVTGDFLPDVTGTVKISS